MNYSNGHVHVQTLFQPYKRCKWNIIKTNRQKVSSFDQRQEIKGGVPAGAHGSDSWQQVSLSTNCRGMMNTMLMR